VVFHAYKDAIRENVKVVGGTQMKQYPLSTGNISLSLALKGCGSNLCFFSHTPRLSSNSWLARLLDVAPLSNGVGSGGDILIEGKPETPREWNACRDLGCGPLVLLLSAFFVFVFLRALNPLAEAWSVTKSGLWLSSF
jgi:hypothetical protein